VQLEGQKSEAEAEKPRAVGLLPQLTTDDSRPAGAWSWRLCAAPAEFYHWTGRSEIGPKQF